MFKVNATLFKIFIMNRFNNTSLNVSEDDIFRIMELNNYQVNYSDYPTSVIPEEEEELKCGGALQDLATTYANVYHPYCSILVCLVGTVTNVLNIIVLTRKDMSCAPINRILTALAVADVILMVEYIPFAYYYHLELLGKRDFPYLGAVFMLFHIHVTQILHTISICLTLSLAIWRYLAIGYPEKTHTLCSSARCTTAIALCYSLPVLLCAPQYFTFKIKSTTVVEDKEYILYHTSLTENVQRDRTLLMVNFWLFGVFIKLLPCCILTGISCWLIRTLFKAKKRKHVLKGYDARPLTGDTPDGRRKATKSERRADRTTKMLVAVLLLFLITEFPQGMFALFIGLNGKDLFLECYQKYGEVMDMMALTNGAINFVLYCCMNRMFRVTFGQLFKRRILGKWTTAAPSEVHTTTAINGTNTTTV